MSAPLNADFGLIVLPEVVLIEEKRHHLIRLDIRGRDSKAHGLLSLDDVGSGDNRSPLFLATEAPAIA